MGARVTNGLTPEQQKERLEIVRREAERAHDRNDRFSKQANKSASSNGDPLADRLHLPSNKKSFRVDGHLPPLCGVPRGWAA